jgi:hypothetical protein
MANIRKYKLTKRLPSGKIMAHVGEITDAWEQNCFSWKSNNEDKLSQFFLNQCPKFKHKCAVIGLHYTNDNIVSHADHLARSVFVFPIKYGKNTEFIVEGESTHFEKGTFYRFNDYLNHQVDNPNGANMVLVTVSFEDV